MMYSPLKIFSSVGAVHEIFTKKGLVRSAINVSKNLFGCLETA